MAQSSKVVNFSDLTEQEKEQYINFVMKNNIDFVEDEEEDRYVARIRIKPDAPSKKPTPTKQVKQSSRQKSQFSTVNSRQNMDSVSSFQSISSKQSLRDLNVQQKENKKTPFVLASTQNVEKPINKITADYMSFRNKSPVDSLSTFETHNENKSLFELMENIDIRRDQQQNSQNQNKNTAASMSSIKSTGSNTRSKSTQPTKETSAVSTRKNNTSMIDEYLSGCIEEYKTFSRLLDLENMASYNRPKKLSLDALSKLIEEILTARFTKETNLLKANLSRGDSTNRSYLSRQRNSSLPYFISEFLREKSKGTKNYQNVGLSLAFSTLLYRRKNERVNLFSKFLSEQNDSEDLTFFLFARSLVEKELAIVLTNKNLSNDGALLNQKNCYRILEAVYGKDEKQLINRVFRKIREQIEWEKEVNIGPDVNKINMYSFLKLLLEDYHSSRLSIAEHTFEDDQDSQSVESGTFHQLEDQNNIKMSEKRRGSMQEEITQEEIKDEIDRYLFSQPTENPTVASTESLPKALNDITNQTNTVQVLQSQNQSQGNLFSNIHNSWYNNPNNLHRNQMYGQFKDNSFEMDQNDNFNSNYLLNADSIRHNSLASLQSRKNTNPAILSKNVSNSRLAAGSVLNKYLEPESSYSTEQKDVPVANFAQAGSRFVNNTKAHHNSRSNSYSDLHRKSNSSLDGQQTSYAQLNSKKMNNTRNNSINEFNTNSDGLNTSYSSCHNSKQSLIPKDKKELERSMEKLNPALSLKDKFASIEKNEVTNENFSFRNSDIKVVHPSQNVASPEDSSRSDTDQIASVNQSRLQTNQTSSQRSFIQNNHQELKGYCLMVMTSKVHDFIEAMLFEGQEEKNSDEQKIMNGLMDLFDRKFKTLLDALFSFDKLKWLSSLMIEDPESKQLQNVEELQKELRGLQRRNFDELDEGDIEVFANKIFRTPELSTQIGRLIVEFTLPQDLLYEDDS